MKVVLLPTSIYRYQDITCINMGVRRILVIKRRNALQQIILDVFTVILNVIIYCLGKRRF